MVMHSPSSPPSFASLCIKATHTIRKGCASGPRSQVERIMVPNSTPANRFARAGPSTMFQAASKQDLGDSLDNLQRYPSLSVLSLRRCLMTVN
jgi:hypothetical protein